jgi:4-amino-4-deoxy-L-arabinose transferase-like glycosyltransferase
MWQGLRTSIKRMAEALTGRVPGRPAYVLTTIFLLALALRLPFSLFFPWSSGDSRGYQQIALNLIAGHGFSWSTSPPFEPNLYRTPVYPLFLAGVYSIFGPGARAVYLLQAAIGSVVCCLTYVIARQFWNGHTAVVAALLCCSDLFAAHYVGNILTETLFTLLMSCAVFLLVRAYETGQRRTMALTGALLGLAALCRPESAIFPLFAAATLVWVSPSRWTSLCLGLVLVGCAVLATVPWLARNWRLTNGMVFLVNRGPGVSFWQSAHPGYDHNRYRFVEGLEQRDDTVALFLSTEGERDLGALEPLLWCAGMKQIRQHPGDYVRRRLLDYSHLWIPSGDFLLGEHNVSFGRALATKRFGLMAVKALILLVIGIAPFLLAVSGLVLNRSHLRRLWPVWVFPFYVALSRLPFDLEPRHSLPARPYLMMFAALALVESSTRLQRRWFKVAAPQTGALSLGHQASGRHARCDSVGRYITGEPRGRPRPRTPSERPDTPPSSRSWRCCFGGGRSTSRWSP